MKKARKHTVTVEINEPKYKRYKIVDDDRRVILIDFRCIRVDPFKPVDYGARRAYLWNNPQQLQEMVDEYFQSCFGPVLNNKTGEFYTYPDGSLVIHQIKPFTISGLALYCHIDSGLVKGYSEKKIDSLGFPTDEDYVGPTYSQIMLEARRKIENYAEERLYDKDGFAGGRFVLDAAFNWVGNKEKAEIDNLYKSNKLKSKELKFRKSQAALGDGIDEPVTITIKRAGTIEES